jgi:hypothetical protein
VALRFILNATYQFGIEWCSAWYSPSHPKRGELAGKARRPMNGQYPRFKNFYFYEELTEHFLLTKAELKGSNQRFTVFGVFNLVITSNGRLSIWLESDQKAWDRRLLIARYETVYSGQRIFDIDRYLLQREAPGILNWCIEGVQMLLADYEQTGDIILPTSQKTRISDLLSESDSLRIFVSNEIVRDDGKMGSGESHSLTVDEIVSTYMDDCINSKGWTPVSIATAEKRLPDLMLRSFGVSKSNGIKRGVRTRVLVCEMEMKAALQNMGRKGRILLAEPPVLWVLRIHRRTMRTGLYYLRVYARAYTYA